MVEDHIDWRPGRLQPQPELLFERREQIRGRIGIARWRVARFPESDLTG
jgi:hypothetical protein